MSASQEIPEGQQSESSDPEQTAATPPEQSTPQPAPERRPKPAFGEYAPEGWKWNPEGTDNQAVHGQERQQTNSLPPAASQPRSGAIPGVPHNLGVAGGGAGSGVTPSTPAQPPQATNQHHTGDPAPYRAMEAPAPMPAAPAPAPAVAPQSTSAAPKPLLGDRILTTLLLVLGTFGALYTAQSMLVLSASFGIIAEALEMKDFSVPTWVGTLGTVSGLAFFAIYAFVLIFSIRRMRARKLTFWVPLAAGVLVFICAIAIPAIAISAMPELLEAASEPGALQKILDYSVSTLP